MNSELQKPEPQKLQLQQLLNLPYLWQASQVRQVKSVVATGYDDLDKQLHDGGWPSDGTTELFVPQIGIGELRLLLPALKSFQQPSVFGLQGQRPWIAFIAPPFFPYASALVQQGINPHAVLIVRPQSQKDLLWSAEQILQSGCCSAVMTWAMDMHLDGRQLRRLQQAAHKGQCWHSLFRHPRFSQQSSPSALRLHLSCSAKGALQVQVLKQRGGWGGQQVDLILRPDLSHLQRLSPEQLPLPKQQYHRQIPDQNGEPAVIANGQHKVVQLNHHGK